MSNETNFEFRASSFDMKALAILGAPGAGKGTQARGIAECFGIPHISTGDILREAVQEGTPLGLAAQKEMEAGRLVPDEVVCGLVKARLQQPDSQAGFILDGFPRTVEQASYLDRLLKSQGRADLLVVNIRVDPELLVKRLTGRLTCPVCGRIYNVYFNPPRQEGKCDQECASLIHRSDDNEQAIRQRFVAYENETKPLIEYYGRRHLLHDFDGDGAPETLTRQLCEFLRRA
jgi:adenylate kinase